MESGEPAVVEQGLGSVEQRCQQHRELDDRLAWIGCAATDPDAEAAGDRRNLCEQAALSHTGGAFDDEHRFGAVGEAFELGSNQREFRVAPVGLPRGARRHRSSRRAYPSASDALSNRTTV